MLTYNYSKMHKIAIFMYKYKKKRRKYNKANNLKYS